MTETTTTPAQMELIPCPICHQRFDPDALALTDEERNRCLIGHRLHEARTTADLSVQAVAERLGVTHAAISRWEHGHKDLPLRRAVQLARLYHVSLDALTEGYRV
jgi:DNA-binding transcriptional regulator YiaG